MSKFQEKVSKLEKRLSKEQYFPKSCKNRRGITEIKSGGKGERSVLPIMNYGKENIYVKTQSPLSRGPNQIQARDPITSRPGPNPI